MVVGSALAGCTVAKEPEIAPTSALSTPAKTPDAETPTSAEPTPTGTPTKSPKQAEYEAEVASWPEPLPPGYSWPDWTQLPHYDIYGTGQLGRADNASGVYRCILIDAAWHAYFEDNDAAASKDYATRADKYVVPDNPSTPLVTQDGLIIDPMLSVANGNCIGIVGELSHN